MSKARHLCEASLIASNKGIISTVIYLRVRKQVVKKQGSLSCGEDSEAESEAEAKQGE